MKTYKNAKFKRDYECPNVKFIQSNQKPEGDMWEECTESEMTFLEFITEDLHNQIFKEKRYSNNPEERQKYKVQEWIDEAKKGSTNSLNCLWNEVREGRLSKDEYYEINNEYEGSR